MLDVLDARGITLMRSGIDLAGPSAQYVRRYPFRFVRFEPGTTALLDAGGHDLLAAAHAMTASRGAEVVSMGVDSPERRDALRSLGSAYLAGDVIGPATPLAESHAVPGTG